MEQETRKEPDYLVRMRQEGEELSERLNKLQAFVEKNPIFGEMSQDERTLMIEQGAAMENYLYVLNQRIKLCQKKQY